MEIKELVDIDELTEKVCNAEYTRPSLMKEGRMETYIVCAYDAEERAAIRRAISEYVIQRAPSEIAAKIAELEAKVFTYEKFVANSTFAPLLNGYISRQAHEKELEEKQDIIDRMAAEKEILEAQYDDLERELKELKKGERSDE